MALITQIINTQAFEFIRDRIGEILFDELNNQFLLSGDYDLDVDVTIESNFPQTNKTALPVVNVSLANGKYDNKDSGGNVSGSYQFNVDIFANSETPAAGQGDRLAALKMHKLMGMCRAILEDPIYKTLGFTPPFISRVFISDVNISEPNKEDALHTIIGRLIFNVQANEKIKLIPPTLISGYETGVRINNTNRGFQFIGVNY